jgi:predicted metal-dependent hydrolase
MATASKKPSVSDQVEYNLQQQAGVSMPGRAYNAEIDQEINAWIEKYPQEYQKIKDVGADYYFRQQVLRKIRRQDTAEQEAEIIRAKLAENPTLLARVRDKLRNVPQERLEAATVSVTKKLLAQDALNQTVKPS